VIRVLLADDQHLVREGFARLLRDVDDLVVVGEASTGREAVEQALATRPDVVLMDVRMPDLDGIEATSRIVAAQPSCRVLMLTTFDIDEAVHKALLAGASGFLLKDMPYDQLVAGIRVVAGGESILAPSVTRRLIGTFTTQRKPSEEEAANLGRLTEREHDVLRLVAKGLSNAEIGQQLFLSETTVKTHVGRVLTKLGCRDRVQAVVLAYRSGYVEDS
jgi:DNA-binding NarL/FixJ family response regulator